MVYMILAPDHLPYLRDISEPGCRQSVVNVIYEFAQSGHFRHHLFPATEVHSELQRAFRFNLRLFEYNCVLNFVTNRKTRVFFCK